MPRRRRCRRVGSQPAFTSFGPPASESGEREETILTLDEFEAVRLKDMEGLDQRVCAEMMDISQPTFHRLVIIARRKIADAMTSGKTLRIEGGDYRF